MEMLQFHRHLGDTFKWLFYSDDDTVFFLDAAKNVVKGLDPDMPYFLTGQRFLPLCLTRQTSQILTPVSVHRTPQGPPALLILRQCSAS